MRLRRGTIAKKILVVDDDAEIVEYVAIGLRHAGFDVASAFDGDEGLVKAREFRPDVLVLDLAMPRVNGYEVCRSVRSDGAFSGLKIIVTSGKSYMTDVRAVKSLGADVYLVKPFNITQLLDSIQGLVGSS